jgi:hypothetical protein
MPAWNIFKNFNVWHPFMERATYPRRLLIACGYLQVFFRLWCRCLDPKACNNDAGKCNVNFFVTHDNDYGEVRKYTPKRSVVQRGYKTGNFLSILEKNNSYSDCSYKREGNLKYTSKSTVVTAAEKASFRPSITIPLTRVLI